MTAVYGYTVNIDVYIYGNCIPLTLYQPMMHICVMSSHKPIRIYMGV